MIRFKSPILFFVVFPLICLLYPVLSFAGLDLHGHYDLKPGIGPLLTGDFYRPALSRKWTARRATKASALTLLSLKKPSLLVLSFYAHPLLSFFEISHREGSPEDWMRQALDLEYAHVSEFARTHANRFEIAKNAAQAEKILAQGKTALILSIEGADGILETEQDLKLWIDERGVAMVTPFHLTEDHLGGTALMPGILGFANSPLDFIKSAWISGGSCLKNFCRSTMGIKPDGRILIERLMNRKVWIDLAHANSMQVQELLSDFEKRNLPLMVSHTEPREYFPAERGLGEMEGAYLMSHDGMIGLIPSKDMIRNSPFPGIGCKSGLEEFKEIVGKMSEKYGKEKVALGSDANAPLNGLSPSCDPLHAESILEKDGFYSHTQWEDLLQYVSPTKDWIEKSQTHFLKLWKRIR